MGKKRPDPRKFWQPSEGLRRDFERFKEALADTIEVSHKAQNAAHALGTYPPDISNFLTGKARGTASNTMAKNLADQLREDRPAAIQSFVAGPVTLLFWENNRECREDLARRLDEERHTHLASAVEPSPDAAGPPPAPPPAPVAGASHPVPGPFADAVVRPKLARVVEVRCSLDESHNIGSPEMPALLVQLTCGSGEPDPPGTEEGAVLRLANCQLLVEQDGAEIVEPDYGSETSFRLAFAGRHSEVKFRRDGASGQEWRSVPGKTGRRLHGRSDYELLCRFSHRPENVSVKVRAYLNDLRLDRKDRDSRDFDEIDRVVAALARIYTLGRTDTGSFVLDSGTPT